VEAVEVEEELEITRDLEEQEEQEDLDI